MELPTTSPRMLALFVFPVMEMLEVEDVQALEEAGVPFPVNVFVLPMQILSSPVMVGSAKTVMLAFCVHPFPFVYVMVVLPLLMPVTTPLLFTEAMLRSAELHPFPLGAGSEPVKLVLDPLHNVKVPVMVGFGRMFKVIVC